MWSVRSNGAEREAPNGIGPSPGTANAAFSVITLSGFSRLLSFFDFRYAADRFPRWLRLLGGLLSHHGDALPERLKDVNDRLTRLRG